jgi:thioredoxin reductase
VFRDRFARELQYLGYPVRTGSVAQVRAAVDGFRVRLATGQELAGGREPAMGREPAGGEELAARAVILATGSRASRLGVPGEAELFQKGLYGSAASYAHLFLDKSVLVAGAGRAPAPPPELSAAGRGALCRGSVSP